MEEVIQNISFDQPDPSSENILFDRVLDVIDVALESDAPSSSASKGKGILVKEEDVDMLTERKYLALVQKDLLGKLFDREQLNLQAFRAKVDSLDPSSEWASRLSIWNEKTSDLENLPDDSSDIDDENSDDRSSGALASVSRTIVTYIRRRFGEGSSSVPTSSGLVNVSSFEVSAPAVTSVSGDVHVSLPSVLAAFSAPSSTITVFVTGISSLGSSSSSGNPLILFGVSTTPLFSTFPSLPGSGNLFATFVGISSSTVPLVFTALPPCSSSSYVYPRDTRPAGPQLKKPVVSAYTPKSSKKFRLKVAFGPRPPHPVAPRPMVSSSAPQSRGTSPSGDKPFPRAYAGKICRSSSGHPKTNQGYH
ncbi:hypothetical protein HanPI659440_Chr07g0255461 [Helianthus annuus]|nr:hypothetical protein HanPI659440_Chr07g0255461 [Helianthus annuus]